MKRILFLFTLICLSTLTCWSQDKGSLHLSLGGALPIGEFGSKDASDEASGLAKLGALAELAYSHPIGKPVGTGHLGLTIGIKARINGIDKDANTQPLKAIFPQYEWSVTNSHWKSFSAMGGIYYIFPASSKVDIRTELDLGIARSYLPAMTILGILDTAHTGATDLVQASVNKAHATSFSGALKAGVVYHLNKRLNIVANLDFWYLEPTFKITQNVVVASHLIVPGNLSLSNASSISVQTNTRNYDQAMNTLNLTVGVAYNF